MYVKAMLSYCSLLVCACALSNLIASVNSGPWASPAQEKLDEIHDAEIYNAVVSSIKEWEARKQLDRREKRETPQACYEDLGCFEVEGPFAYLEMVPGPPEDVNTKFFLYPSHKSRKSGFTHLEIPFSNLSDAFNWGDRGFNKELPTKVLIHGFGSDCSHIWVYEMRSALMAVEEMNLICVDWSKGAELPNYVKAVINTRLVGRQVSNLLKGLMEKSGLMESKVHLIGFSLGAHVAGFAGANLGNISRITGLDPAGPLFESQDPRARLDQTDAHFVDVIHSNGENLILGGLGSWQPLGHVDFYPNGGRMQKGCSHIFLGAVTDIIWSSSIEGRSLCNHRRAYKFFTDSVSPRCHFPAFPCNSYGDFLEGNCFPCTDERECGNMGYYADRWHGRGQLFLITREEEPFCAHQYKINIKTSSTDVPVVSYGKLQVMLLGDSTLNETFVMTKKDDEEMVLGHEISRMFVPHPILADPTKIEILYTAYSGWISSGLTHWKIDKITLSDSFGQISSICQKSIILESGKPLVLPLHKGDCQLQEIANNTEDQNSTSAETLEKTENRLSLSNAISIFNIPWLVNSDKENAVEDEKETSRALNVKYEEDSPNFNHTNNATPHEIVEPVLKAQNRKNARAHSYVDDKSEISEPILGSTTTKKAFDNEDLSKRNARQEPFDFYDTGKDEWSAVSARDVNVLKGEERNKHTTEKPAEFGGFSSIFTTVQILPVKLARMFEQAEKYARETILPFVSAHTPKIIRDFIAPDRSIKYLPLSFDDTIPINITKHIGSETFDLATSSANPISTSYSHIQKISKRKEFGSHESGRDFSEENLTDEKLGQFSSSDEDVRSDDKIYVNLPVIDKNVQPLKYIPITKSGAN
ncbi:hypothetical protein PPYR_11289 [Photinus pyralis]|uniref:Lipase domain-containing protein n=1 Tax=Photinus pyralis TaxID=7054 RepID=A0A1Y1LYU8_PHOPY|nr:uncharacterized protein LOC116176709 [Photinus pyralis]XP_031351313.1 uncharacterized protein LOC116176709 [Photinus pyralis]XP_031351314.1 uncharacterized protein LOC116176709 [Photinus pyralis]KAB0794450.1 hypothetical protein PPYR_11289 [Photinus pyralis]